MFKSKNIMTRVGKRFEHFRVRLSSMEKFNHCKTKPHIKDGGIIINLKNGSCVSSGSEPELIICQVRVGCPYGTEYLF